MPLRFSKIASASALLMALATTAVSAADLSKAMQLFFAGDYGAAETQLSALTSDHSSKNDPRVFYFRGLTKFRQGKPSDAASDFRQAAALEVARPGANVGRALERIQGIERLELEKFRRLAHLQARQRTQPDAPPLFPETQIDQLPPGTSQIKLALRLASEVPVPTPGIDNFSDDVQKTGSPAAEKNATSPLSRVVNDEPVGTGVARGDTASQAQRPVEPNVQGAEEREPGIFGTVFRALGRAVGGSETPAASDGEDAADEDADLFSLEPDADNLSEIDEDDPFKGF